MMSYIKVYGPPLLKAIKELEKVAVDMPEVCIMSNIIAESPPESYRDSGWLMDYFTAIPGVGSAITVERCNNIISKSGEQLGEYDFFFEWFTGPSSASWKKGAVRINPTAIRKRRGMSPKRAPTVNPTMDSVLSPPARRMPPPMPRAEPDTPRMIASRRTLRVICPRVMPIVRSIPISRVRSMTVIEKAL